MAKRKRQHQNRRPPRVRIVVMLERNIAHGLIDIAAMERWSLSRTVAYIITDWFGRKRTDK